MTPRYWLPSDINPDARASIAAWQQSIEPCETLYPAIELDASSDRWLVESDEFELPAPIEAIVNINMIHIAPISACMGLFAGAQRILPSGGIVYLYGPFKQGGVHTAASNAAFDESLQLQNPAWGVRDLMDVANLAQSHNLKLQKIFPMPANNLSVIFQLR